MAEISKMVIKATQYGLKDETARNKRAVNYVIGTDTGTDLNGIKTPGFYSAAGSNSATNKPSGIDAFGMTVTHDATGEYYTQVLNSANQNPGKCYRRVCTNGTWGAWKEINKDKVDSAAKAESATKAESADKIGTSTVGSAAQPVYINAGKPTACTYTLGKSVPADAKFTDTVVTVDSALNSTSTNPVQNKIIYEALGGKVGKDSMEDYQKKVENTYAKKADISSVYKFKGSVKTYADLPTKDQAVGDTYNIEAADTSKDVKAGDNLAWNGSAWDNLSGTVDLSAYATTSAMNTALANKVNKDGSKVLSTHDFTDAYKTKLDGIASGATKDSVMTAATASAAGKSGLVPSPAAGKQASFLRGDGTWATPTNTQYSAATTTTAGLMSAADKAKLNGIASGANAYSLPDATGSAKGGVKIGSNITVSSGEISLTDANVVNALGYTPASTAIATKDTKGLMSNTDKTTVNQITNGQLPGFYDQNGGWREPTNAKLGTKVLACYMAKQSSPDAGFNGDTSFFNWLYMDPYSSDDAGGATALGISRTTGRAFIMRSAADRAKFGNVTEIATTDASSVFSTSKNGTVPKPSSSDTTKFLRGDGTWQAASYSAATTTAAGLMSAADKVKLNGIAENANKYSLPDATASAKGGVTIGSNITVNSGKISVPVASASTAGVVKVGSNISVSNGTISVPVASTSTAGVMSAADKKTLDELDKLRNTNQVMVLSAAEYSSATKSNNTLYFII